MKRTRTESSTATAPAPAAAPLETEAGPGNAAIQAALVDAQLAEPDVAKHRTSVLEAACKATNRMFEVDSGGFVDEQLDLLESLDAMRDQHARMEARDRRIDAHGDARYGDVFVQRTDRLEELPKTFQGTYGLGGWLLPTQYEAHDGTKPLLGSFDREGNAPAVPTNSEGIGAWQGWAERRGSALEDLMTRAESVREWCDAHTDALWDAYENLQPFLWATLAASHPAPGDLLRATGREYLYLLEVMKDELPDDIVAAAYARDRGEVVIEQEALDAGVTPERLPELDALVAELTALDDAIGGMAELSELPAAEQEYVLRHLRWTTEAISAFTLLSAELADEDLGETFTGSPEEATHQQDLRDVVAGTSMGAWADGEDLWDLYDKKDAAADMARGLPGATGNVMWGMVRSVPIAGDLVDLAVGDQVDAGLQSLNEDWMGLDHESSDFQERWGQAAGVLAGSIGLAGVMGPGGASTATLSGKSVQVPAQVAKGLWYADMGNNAAQAGSGYNLQGEELDTWQRVLAGVGLVAGAGTGLSQSKKAAVSVEPEHLTNAAQATKAAEHKFAVQGGLINEVNYKDAYNAEVAARIAHESKVGPLRQMWEDLAITGTTTGVANTAVRSGSEAWSDEEQQDTTSWLDELVEAFDEEP